MIKYGELIAYRPDPMAVKVIFKDEDNMETGWLPVCVPFALGDKIKFGIQKNAQVACIMDEECNTGIAVGCIYSEADKTDLLDDQTFEIEFDDGALITYSKTTHIMGIVVPENVEIQAKKLKCTGDIESLGNVSDNKGTMQAMRDIYNGHAHGCPDGGTNSTTAQM